MTLSRPIAWLLGLALGVAATAALPHPILAAFKAAYPHATIQSAVEKKQDGKVVWEVESTDNGLVRDLLYAVDGSVLEIEEAIPSAQLPPPVIFSVKAHFPAARIIKALKVTRGAKVSYELQLAGVGKKSVELAPDGKLLSK